MSPDVQFWIGFILTILVLSYLAGDNFLYRLAMHVLVGVGAAFAVAVAISQVLYPGIFVRINSPSLGDKTLGLFAALGCAFLLAKLLRRASWLGNVAVGYLLGVGAGVAIGGALLGTLIPQTFAASAALDSRQGVLVNLLILAATVTTLIAFTYARASRRGALGAVGAVGRACLYVALGATFALVFIAGASVLADWMRDTLSQLGLVTLQ